MEKQKPLTRKKPKFLRKDWHKKIKLGSQNKKKMKWRGAKGRHNKIRLGIKGHSLRPKIGWRTNKKSRETGNSPKAIRVENIKDLESAGKNPIIIGKIGRRKRKIILEKANEMKLKILNKYNIKEAKK